MKLSRLRAIYKGSHGLIALNCITACLLTACGGGKSEPEEISRSLAPAGDNRTIAYLDTGITANQCYQACGFELFSAWAGHLHLHVQSSIHSLLSPTVPISLQALCGKAIAQWPVVQIHLLATRLRMSAYKPGFLRADPSFLKIQSTGLWRQGHRPCST